MVLAGRKTSPSHLITPSLIIPLASFELDEALIKGVNLWLSLQLLLQFAPPVRREGGGSFWFELRLRKRKSRTRQTQCYKSALPPFFSSLAAWRTAWQIQLVDSQICIGSLFRFARVRDLEMGDLFCISPDQKPFWQRQFLHQLTPLTLIRRGVSQESPFKGGNWNERFVVIEFSQPSTQMSSFSQEVTSLEKLLQNIESWKERVTPCFQKREKKRHRKLKLGLPQKMTEP